MELATKFDYPAIAALPSDVRKVYDLPKANPMIGALFLH
jgi:hypothetical protein